MSQNRKQNSIFGWFRRQLDRYRRHALITIAVLATLLLIASSIFPQIQAYFQQQYVLELLTLLILVDIAIAFEGYRADQSNRVMENQDESILELTESLSRCKGIDLLEYAAATTLPLIRAACRRKLPIRLLTKHPDTIEGLQQQRSIVALDTLLNSVFECYTGTFEVRCYKLPYSLRGRHLRDQVLELGWLTPDYKHKTAFGHQNPSYLLSLTDSKNVQLRDFFVRTFDDYWNHPDTEDGQTVLEQFGAKN